MLNLSGIRSVRLQKQNAMARNPRIDRLLGHAEHWRDEAEALREILLDCGLTEELKWRSPCYAKGGKNVCIIQSMKDFLALLFFKGALLKDPDGLLERQGPFSNAGYRMRFTSVSDVVGAASSIRAYVREAIEVERAGRKVEKGPDLDYPGELVAALAEDRELEAAFGRLTPGRQRGYVLHFSGAKQSKTRAARIRKCRPRILAGKGFQDR